MSKITEPFSNYFHSTKSLLYSYLISLPLLLLYEVLIFISQPNSDHMVRIAVDVWIRSLFSYFGNDVLSITLIFVALLGIIILYRERHKLSSLRASYFFIMVAESAVYAFLLALIISKVVTGLLQVIPAQDPVETLSTLQKLALSLGAGLYEELFFRVILVSVLLFIFKYIFSRRWVASMTAMVLAALLFSAAHYVGAMGDPFSIGSFLFRFLFGLALNAIYIWRGFGTAAWTHAIYDLMVVAVL